MRVWSAHAVGNPTDRDRSAEHGIAADRFAREIVRFLKLSYAAHSQQLNAKPFGAKSSFSIMSMSVQ